MTDSLSTLRSLGEEWDPARVPGEDAAVEERGDRASGRSYAIAAQRLSPDVEEITERVRPMDRRFGVDDPVGRVRVQPHEARRAGNPLPITCA